MELFQILLPLFDNSGGKLRHGLFKQTVAELTDRFGGATAFTRNPAEGFWEDPGGRVERDDVVVVEVMAEDADAEWWTRYKATLEGRFQQETILIRAMTCRIV